MDLNKIKGMRASLGLTQKDMAIEMGLSKQTYVYKEINDAFTANDIKLMMEVFNSRGLSVEFPRDFF